jgi:ketosteroid isomerase-like protein
MSEENVELVKLATGLWNRGDIDAFFALLHPEFEWHGAIFPGLDPVYRGHDGYRKFWHDFRDPWESVDVVIETLRDRGDQVVALGHFEAQGRDGIAVRRPIAWVTTIREGLLVRGDVYGDWDQALEAVGLSE